VKRIVAITMFFEVLLIAMMAYSIMEMVSYWAFTAFFSVLLMPVPALLAAKDVIKLPWPIVVSIGLALVLHNLGLVTYWYDTSFWWDKLTHLMSGVVIAALVAIELILLDQLTESIYIPPIWYLFLVLIAILTLEAVWEMLEFMVDMLLQLQMQHSLVDTANDVITNLASGLIGGVGVVYYLKRHSADELIANLHAEKLVQWFVVRFGEPDQV
jgi:hypothetical protein